MCAVRAVGTDGAQSDDFNVMTARSLPRPEVTVEHDGAVLPAGGTLCLFALGDGAGERRGAWRGNDLLIWDRETRIPGAGRSSRCGFGWP